MEKLTPKVSRQDATAYFSQVLPGLKTTLTSYIVKIWLDDVRPAPEGWLWLNNPVDVIHYLDKGVVGEVSLDHDLGDDDLIGTGYNVLLWLERTVAERDFVLPIIHVHSQNPVARIRMLVAIDNICKIAASRKS